MWLNISGDEIINMWKTTYTVHERKQDQKENLGKGKINNMEECQVYSRNSVICEL